MMGVGSPLVRIPYQEGKEVDKDTVDWLDLAGCRFLFCFVIHVHTHSGAVPLYSPNTTIFLTHKSTINLDQLAFPCFSGCAPESPIIAANGHLLGSPPLGWPCGSCAC